GGRIWLEGGRGGGGGVVSVPDNGIGIPARALGDNFDMFSQVERPVERRTRGLGVGVGPGKGVGAVRRGPGRGPGEGEGEGESVTFTVPLPVAGGRAAPAPAAPPNGHAAAGRRILVVDDNRDGADSLAMMLRLLGSEVRTANDGIDAVGQAERFRPE